MEGFCRQAPRTVRRVRDVDSSPREDTTLHFVVQEYSLEERLCHPISTNDKNRFHQLSPKVFNGILDMI